MSLEPLQLLSCQFVSVEIVIDIYIREIEITDGSKITIKLGGNILQVIFM